MPARRAAAVIGDLELTESQSASEKAVKAPKTNEGGRRGVWQSHAPQ